MSPPAPVRMARPASFARIAAEPQRDAVSGPQPVTAPPAVGNQALLRVLQKRPAVELSLRASAQIAADVDRIADLLRSQWLDAEDEQQIVDIVRSWAVADRQLGPAAGTPHLDRLLLLTKTRGYARATARSGFMSQTNLVYDDLFRELEDDRLTTFESLASRSSVFTGPPGTGDAPENFWHTMGKKEAVGLWGILKGMGTSAAGMVDAGAWAITKQMKAAGLDVADPVSAAAWLAQQYDLSGDAMFGREEWSQGEELFLGMSAAEFSTHGGEAVWALVMMGKGPAGAKWAQAIEKAIGLSSNMMAIDTSAREIVAILEAQQKALGRLDAGLLMQDPAFHQALLRLVANAFGAASGNSQKAQRISALLEAAQLSPIVGRLIEIATSDAAPKEKAQRVGPVLMDLIKQVIATAGAVQSARQAPPDAKPSPGPEGAPAEARAAVPRSVEVRREPTRDPPAPPRKKRGPPPAARPVASSESAPIADPAEVPTPVSREETPTPTVAPALTPPVVHPALAEGLTPQQRALLEMSLATQGSSPDVPRARVAPRGAQESPEVGIPSGEALDFLARERAAARPEQRVQLEAPSMAPDVAAGAAPIAMMAAGTREPAPAGGRVMRIEAPVADTVEPVPLPTAPRTPTEAPGADMARMGGMGLEDLAPVSPVTAPEGPHRDVVPVDVDWKPPPRDQVRKTIGPCRGDPEPQSAPPVDRVLGPEAQPADTVSNAPVPDATRPGTPASDMARMGLEDLAPVSPVSAPQLPHRDVVPVDVDWTPPPQQQVSKTIGRTHDVAPRAAPPTPELSVDEGPRMWQQQAQEPSPVELEPGPHEPLELDTGPRSGPGELPDFQTRALETAPADAPPLKLYRGKRPINSVVPRARQTHGERSDERSGTHRRTGTSYGELNAAEIAQDLRVDYDPVAGRPNEVRYRVDADTSQREVQTDRGFVRDDSTLGAQATDADYVGTGLDRGHLAQREAFKGDPDVERAADLMINVVPMTVDLNRGQGSLWRAAEADTIRLAGVHGSVQVIVNPIYDPVPARMPNGTPIPAAIRRRVLAPDGTVLQDVTLPNT